MYLSFVEGLSLMPIAVCPALSIAGIDLLFHDESRYFKDGQTAYI